MRPQTARPLRALAMLMTIYVGGRIAMAVSFPEFAVIGLHSDDRLLASRAEPVQPVGRGPALTTASNGGDAGGDFGLMRAHPITSPSPSHAAFTGTSKQERPAEPLPVHRVGMGTLQAPTTRRTGFARLVAGDAPLPPESMRAQLPGLLTPVPESDGSPALPVGRERGRALSGSAWLLVRDGSRGASLAPGGTLGGSQSGARLNWQPAAAPVFLTVRASATLATRDNEVAPGIGVRGKSAGVILEQRLPLQRGRSSQTALVAYGGLDDVPAPLGFRLDGFAQAGAVGVSHPALFVDGAARAERAVTRLGRTRLGLGVAAWGAAQPGLGRVDVGPQAVLHVLLRSAGVRLSAEYRFRVAGNARPADGLTATLGADF